MSTLQKAESGSTLVGGIKPSLKTVAETTKQFSDAYTLPIVPAYRTIVMDLLTTTHLAVVDSRFVYDPLFALGMSKVFEEFFKAYPGGQSEPIFDATVSALDMDPATLKADAAAVMAWVEGKTEAELEAMFESPGTDQVGSALAAIKANDNFLYTRLFGVGMFTVLNSVGVETITDDVLDTWSARAGFKSAKFAQDHELYTSSISKLRDMEQLFKEIEIREKKKLAARLEEKAAAAAKAAEEAKAAAAPAEEAPKAAVAEQQSAEV